MRPQPDPPTAPIEHLVAEPGATMPRGDLPVDADESDLPPAEGRPSIEILDEMREDRV